MFDDEGRQAFVALQGLVNEFWKVGEENLRLIQDGKKDEAFAFLVDRTIPARNKILTVLDGEKSARASACPLTINEVKSLAAADRNIAVAVMVLVVACLRAWAGTCARWCATWGRPARPQARGAGRGQR